MKALICAILAAVSLAATATESPGDFAFAVPIEGLGGDALYRVAIPQAVYEAAAFPDLRDLRVFNGAGEVVPYAFRPVERTMEKPAPVALAIFPLRGPRDARSEDLDLSFDKSGGKVSVRLSSRQAKAGPQALLGYLIDASVLKTPLNGIEMDWGRAAADRLVSARLEAGDDLKHWTILAADAPLGALAHAGRRLERKAIEYRSLKAKYLRLMWTDPAQAIELTAIAGLSPEQHAQPERSWKEVVATLDAGKPDEYLADLGGRFPVDRLALRLPQENTIVPIQFLSRGKPEDKWMPVTRAVVYRLKQNGRELVSPDIAVGVNSHRYWMLRVDPAAGGIGSGSLIVRVGWTPREIVFTARGSGPFRMAYGNSKAQAGSLGIETLVPGWRTDQEPQMSVASTGPAQKFAGESAARQRIDVKKWGLWAALFAGVAVLAWMAWRLSKQMQRPDTK
ncbi:MAG TPA: DUF3999 domain-containing protein [Burkholderiales bacterium]|jgi:hypothetical protein|nr:DUF3999 domain-containing protein [Burkholderiales bacterium]